MRVLVVDDEIYTREGILESVDWESLGVEETMDADDGLTALSIAEWFRPDIVISDVKMPQMDGISFAKEFLGRFPDSKIIFMSAYLEIHYYQQAIKLSAVDYVEKPLDMDEMVAAIRKAVKGIEENREKRDGQQKGRIILEEQAVHYLINPRRKAERCQELCRQIGFPTEGDYICLCFKDLEREDDRQSVILMIHEFFEERKLPCLAAKNDGYCYCSILHLRGISGGRYSMAELGGQFTNRYPSFQIGLGFPVDHLSVVSESWQLARDALNQAFYEPQRTVFEKGSLAENTMVVDSGIYSRVNRVLMGEPAKLQVVINAVFSEFEKSKALSPSSVKVFARAIARDILKQMGEGVEEELFFGQPLEEYIENSESLDEVHQILATVSGKLLGSEDTVGVSPVVKNAYRCIRRAFDRPELGLAEIADESGISTGYLSMVFKKETGTTVRQYIEDYRIEAAKDRLMHTNERIQDISGACGFAQHGYFSRVFKQKTGMTPAEFRERHYE